jgi:hypothetical protein
MMASKLHTFRTSIAVPLFVLASSLAAHPASAAEKSEATGGFKSKIAPFFQAHCTRCHGPEKSKGEITLHTLDGGWSTGRDLEKWELILEMLESGEMPPEGEPQPDGTERELIVDWIEAGLREAVRRALLPVDGKGTGRSAHPTTRRLTNFEYQNTMRDLLGFELNLIKNLPEDPLKPYHFNNTAQFMLIGPEQMDRYKENARRAMASAIVDPGQPKVYRTSTTWDAAKPGKGGLTQAEIAVYAGPGVGRKTVGLKGWPATGEYRIRIKAGGNFPPGFAEVPLRLVMGTVLRHDGGFGIYRPVGTVHLTNDVDNIQEFEFRGRIENHPIQVGQITAKGQKPPSIIITAQNLFDNGQLNDHRASGFDASWAMSAPRVVLMSLEFEAPVTDVWPPVHHTRILFDSPLRESNPDAYLREVLRRFISRAFRRPATDDEVERFENIYRLFESEFDTYEGAIRETLAMVLISPQFLYHTVSVNPEHNPQYALASRLSYFVWSSMPDAKLMALAEARKLDDPKVIGQQVLRLLADERSGQFVDNFTTQWLSLDKMKSVNINQDLFPRFLYYVHIGERRGQEISFRPTIRDHMHAETVGFVSELIRRNASVLNVVDSDFAYLNEPLAAHYGVEGVQGLKLRPVPIRPEHHLGGLLTHGSVLIGNGTGSAPHPIYRAVWLREAILGDDVKPPPAEVPALSDSAGDAADQAVTIKDLLARHRTVESCNDCHVRLDPWGIPFERYNAIGKYQRKVPKEGTRVSGFRKKQHVDYAGYREYLDSINTIEVEADARVPHGPEVDGMKELKAYLLKNRRDDIAENALRRLLTYGLGRELTYRDRFDVKRLLQQSKDNDYKLADMIVAICQSKTYVGRALLPVRDIGGRAGVPVLQP